MSSQRHLQKVGGSRGGKKEVPRRQSTAHRGPVCTRSPHVDRGESDAHTKAFMIELGNYEIIFIFIFIFGWPLRLFGSSSWSTYRPGYQPHPADRTPHYYKISDLMRSSSADLKMRTLANLTN